MRLNVVGTSGSGKSTFAVKLSQLLSIPYVQMDALYWKDQWQELGDDAFSSVLEQALDQPHWILDGNYNRTQPIKWRHVDIVVWLDYGFVRTLFQAVIPAIRRAATKVPRWGTDYTESFKKNFFSKDSVVVWTFKTYYSNRQRYLADMRDPAYQHMGFVRLRSPSRTRQCESTVQNPWRHENCSQ